MTRTFIDDDIDRRTITIFLAALVCLWGAHFGVQWAPNSFTRLTEMSWWAATQIVFYLVVPMIALAFVGGRPGDVGWKLRGIGSHWRPYGVIFAVASPFVVIASRTAEFQDRYPLYEIYPGQFGVWGDLAVWWPLYVLQFVAIESFFRGFLVLGLGRRLGAVSVLVATVPYLMIHLVKPPVEALASIVGGLVMGTLAWHTKSIWWGVAVHVGVAMSMDLLSLGHKGFLW
ncbi:MAG: CPBP family intramembrane glutamic endopeptidase [Actinomycetota bacterium]